jgi:hypothetical protein
MADTLNDGRPHTQVEELEPLSPGVDYGLRNDDGFDPAKYDFYNPSYRTTSKAFVLHLDEYVYSLISSLLAMTSTHPA